MKNGKWTRREALQTGVTLPLTAAMPDVPVALLADTGVTEVAKVVSAVFSPLEHVKKLSAVLARDYTLFWNVPENPRRQFSELAKRLITQQHCAEEEFLQLKGYYGEAIDELLQKFTNAVEMSTLAKAIKQPSALAELWSAADAGETIQGEEIRKLPLGNEYLQLIKGESGISAYFISKAGQLVSIDSRFLSGTLDSFDLIAELAACRKGRAGLYDILPQLENAPVLQKALTEVLCGDDGALASRQVKSLFSHQYGNITLGELRRQFYPGDMRGDMRTVAKLYHAQHPQKQDRANMVPLWRHATGLNWQAIETHGKITHYAADIFPTETRHRTMWGEVPCYTKAQAIKAAVDQLELEQGEAAKYRLTLIQSENGEKMQRLLISRRIFHNPAYPARVRENLQHPGNGEQWKNDQYWAAAKTYQRAKGYDIGR